MNFIWNLSEMAVSWAFPQVGATLSAYRWGSTAYKVSKCGASLLTGNFVGAATVAANTVVTCEEIRDKCILAVFEGKIYLPDDVKEKGWKTIACWVMYGVCKVFK